MKAAARLSTSLIRTVKMSRKLLASEEIHLKASYEIFTVADLQNLVQFPLFELEAPGSSSETSEREFLTPLSRDA